MNLSTVGAGTRTVEAFASEINEETDPAGPCKPRVLPPGLGGRERSGGSGVHSWTLPSRADAKLRAPVAQHTYPAHDAPLRASGARHPEKVSVLIHIV